jgi:hypothetical protein
MLKNKQPIKISEIASDAKFKLSIFLLLLHSMYCFSYNELQPVASFTSTPAIANGTITLCAGETITFTENSKIMKLKSFTFERDSFTLIQKG